MANSMPLTAAFNFAGKCTTIRTRTDQNFGEKLEVLNSSARFPDTVHGPFRCAYGEISLVNCSGGFHHLELEAELLATKNCGQIELPKFPGEAH